MRIVRRVIIVYALNKVLPLFLTHSSTGIIISILCERDIHRVENGADSEFIHAGVASHIGRHDADFGHQDCAARHLIIPRHHVNGLWYSGHNGAFAGRQSAAQRGIRLHIQISPGKNADGPA